MKTIHKFNVSRQLFDTIIKINASAMVLPFIKVTEDNFFFWVEVDTDKPVINRYFKVYGTGWEIPENAEYIGTVFEEGIFVWHLYELL